MCSTVSEGAIVPKKSWYGLVTFEWTDGEWSYGKYFENVQLNVENIQRSESQLKILEPQEAKKMLDVFLAIDGNNTAQIKYMQKVAEQWSKKVRVGHITRVDAWTAFTSTVMKTLEYPLLALTLSESECGAIMSPVLSEGLPKMGICRSMARSLVHAPTKFQGLGIYNLYTTQGLIHVKELLNHIWRKTETGKLLRTTMEFAKLEAGIRGSLFALDYELHGHLCEDT